LAAGQIARRSRDRDPAWRLRAHGAQATIEDVLHGHYAGPVDDFVLLRGDGVPAYNLAAVVDDGQMGVDQVVRGDDLLSSAPRQHYLAKLLGFEPVEYAHVPLALGPSGFRLAKRDGAVTLSQLARAGIVPSDVLCTMANSLGLAAPKEPVTLELLARRFDPARLPREPWVVRTGAAEGL
jgi:glutamyl-tRNA synthetase